VGIAMAQSPDCIVMGGGMIGCSVAAALARRGVSIMLLDVAAAHRGGDRSGSDPAGRRPRLHRRHDQGRGL
jgi:2-polyprenyl-6-methoxyphenol hydroxylase-like FAD-dependent oxidoreductase